MSGGCARATAPSSGEAANSIAGLSITNQNYKGAVEILQYRYGDRQSAISWRLDTLVDLLKIDSADDFSRLWTLFNKTSDGATAGGGGYGGVKTPTFLKMWSFQFVQKPHNQRTFGMTHKTLSFGPTKLTLTKL